MKRNDFEYPQIDLIKTGEWLRTLCKHFGYSVKDIQEKLHISSNQAIYEWFNGHTLPSVNNLLALSVLFHIPMNNLLVDNVHEVIFYEDKAKQESMARCVIYHAMLNSNIVRMQKHGA